MERMKVENDYAAHKNGKLLFKSPKYFILTHLEQYAAGVGKLTTIYNVSFLSPILYTVWPSPLSELVKYY